MLMIAALAGFTMAGTGLIGLHSMHPPQLLLHCHCHCYRPAAASLQTWALLCYLALWLIRILDGVCLGRMDLVKGEDGRIKRNLVAYVALQ